MSIHRVRRCSVIYKHNNILLFINYIVPTDLYTEPNFIDEETINLTSSQSFYLNVNIVANPPPTVTWYKGSTLLTSGASFSAVGDTGVASLYFASLTTSDAGVYTVNITNPVGFDLFAATLNVNGIFCCVSPYTHCHYIFHI